MTQTLRQRKTIQEICMSNVILHPQLTASMAENLKDAHDMDIAMTEAGNLRLQAKLEQARERFGRPFAHQEGTDWSPRQTPVLTEWMANRKHTNGPEAA